MRHIRAGLSRSGDLFVCTMPGGLELGCLWLDRDAKETGREEWSECASIFSTLQWLASVAGVVGFMPRRRALVADRALPTAPPWNVPIS